MTTNSDRDVLTAKALTGDVIESGYVLTVEELCEKCFLAHEQIVELVHEGILDPDTNSPGQWRFTYGSVRRVLTVQRLQSDLGVNLAGAALALELLDRLDELEHRLRQLNG